MADRQRASGCRREVMPTWVHMRTGTNAWFRRWFGLIGTQIPSLDHKVSLWITNGATTEHCVRRPFQYAIESLACRIDLYYSTSRPESNFTMKYIKNRFCSCGQGCRALEPDHSRRLLHLHSRSSASRLDPYASPGRLGFLGMAAEARRQEQVLQRS